MKISTITYAKLFNLGNYENERIEATAILQEGDDVNKIYQQLRDTVEKEHSRNEKYQEYLKVMKIKDQPEHHTYTNVVKANQTISDFLKDFPHES